MIEFYEIDNTYMQMLHDSVDKKVLLHNEDKQIRKFIAVKIKFNNCDYYIPLSSPGDEDYVYKNGIRTVRKTNAPTIMRFFKGIESTRNFLGKLLFNNMIPAPNICVKKVDISTISDEKYKKLLYNQYRVLRKTKNWNDIQNRARTVYSLKLREASYNYINATVNFLALEEACKLWSFEHLDISIEKEMDEVIIMQKADEFQPLNWIKIKNGEYSRSEEFDESSMDIQNIKLYAKDEFGQEKHIEIMIQIKQDDTL